MGLKIGSALMAVRKKKNKSQANVCRGICGISTYSQYESGERIPDILSLSMFFERLGYTPNGLTVYLSEDSFNFVNGKRN